MARHDHSKIPMAHDADASPGYIIWDCRNGHVIPAVGSGEKPSERVYSHVDANKLAVELNCFVLKNADLPLAKLVAEGKVTVDGPFYVRRTGRRSKYLGVKVPDLETSKRPGIRKLLSELLGSR